MSDSIAVSGTRRAMKELVDGTIRVQIDIDPEFRDDFLRLFSDIDMAVALTPLQHAPAPQPEKRAVERGENWRNLGPLAQSAIMLCKESVFQQFVAENIDNHSGFKHASEEECAAFVKDECGVGSRKDLDKTDGGKTRFGDLMARYKDWQLLHP